jgi:thioredoxin 1
MTNIQKKMLISHSIRVAFFRLYKKIASMKKIQNKTSILASKALIFKCLFFLLIFNTEAQTKRSNLLSVNDFENKLKTVPNPQLVDVRTVEEFQRGHLRKAININFNDDNFEDLVKTQLKKNQPVFVYCFSGRRSSDAVSFLKDLGYPEVYDLAGGFAKWTASSKPYVSSSTTTKPIAALTMENVDKIIKSNNIVLLDFYAEWCGPCKKMSPILNKIANENKGLKLMKIDAEFNDGVANAFRVEEIPTYFIFKRGKQVWRGSGEISEVELLEILNKLK